MINAYVDLDGVLNQVGAWAGAGGWDPHCYRREGINGFVITWHTDLVHRLREALDQPHIRPVWLTTWAGEAPLMISPALGIGADWDVLYPESRSDYWKRNALIRDVDTYPADKVLWLDDDAPYDPHDFVGSRLRITPETRVGLTKQDLDAIKEFVK